MVNLNEIKQEAVINYPIFWEYKVIFEMSADAKNIIHKILNQREFSLKKAHQSKGGKYQSYALSVYVDSKNDRIEIFNKLKDAAKFVL